MMFIPNGRKTGAAERSAKTGRGRRLPLFYVSIVNSVLIVAAVGLENLAPARSGLGSLLVYAPQQGFGVLPFLLLLGALQRRDFRLAALNLVALAVWANALLGWNVPMHALFSGGSGSQGLRLMTYNVQRGERGMPGLMATINAQNPDIFCVQESQDPPPKHFSFPGDELKKQLKGWNFAQGGDVLTLSRFPLLSQRLWPLDGPRRIAESVWQTPRGPVRVLNVHIVKSDAERKLQDRAFTSFASQLLPNARVASLTRQSQIPALETAIAAQPEIPLIVAGDFNTPPRGPFYRALNARLDDAWKQAGWGTQVTFPSRLPLVGIDHIFLRGARATRAFVPDSRASDHRPLVADLSLDK